MAKKHKEQLPIGTRIKFLQTLTCDATEDHPAILYAEKGERGEVTGYCEPEGHMVKRDNWDAPFGAVLGVEFDEAFLWQCTRCNDIRQPGVGRCEWFNNPEFSLIQEPKGYDYRKVKT